MDLREARLKARRTQAGLARDVGLKQGTISAYEAGTRQPPVNTARAIEEALGLPPGSIEWPNPKEASA